MSSKTIKFALIGCGKIAEKHAEHITNVGELVACCDIVESKALKLATKYNAKSYKYSMDLLSSGLETDVVSICSPNGLHAQHSIEALNSGFHVLCEKPLANSVSDCGEMIKVAEINNRRLFAIKQNRFNPPVVAVKKALDSGILGRIYSIQLSCFWNRNADYYRDSWKGTKDLDGGTLYTQFSHFIDLIYWIVGDVKNVHAFTRNFAHKDIIEFEDTGVIALEFYSGAIGTINYTVNSFGKNMEGSLTIFAENGTIKIGGQYLNELEYHNIENFVFGDLPSGGKANEYGIYQGSMSNHDKVYENLVDVLTNGDSISTNSFEALKTVEIIDKIYQSATKNHNES